MTLRHRGKMHHTGLGRPYVGGQVILLVASREVQVLGVDGSPLRTLVLDPTRDYQPQG